MDQWTTFGGRIEKDWKRDGTNVAQGRSIGPHVIQLNGHLSCLCGGSFFTSTRTPLYWFGLLAPAACNPFRRGVWRRCPPHWPSQPSPSTIPRGAATSSSVTTHFRPLLSHLPAQCPFSAPSRPSCGPSAATPGIMRRYTVSLRVHSESTLLNHRLGALFFSLTKQTWIWSFSGHIPCAGDGVVR